MKNIFTLLIILGTFLHCNSLRQFTKDDVIRLRQKARKMFYHGYDSYLKYAANYDELKPLSCSGENTWSSSSLTLIDSLDTLIIMKNYSEFKRVSEYIIANIDFDKDINVSVFETNIRVVGGLLSAHLLAHKAKIDLEPGFPCNGPLLRLAEKVARKLLVAFDTKTGMPYGTVNLKYGVPPDETSVTCVAAIGTFIVEFGTLSRLTGDPIYEEVALNALYSLFNHRSSIGLLGNHIDVQTGIWTAQDSGIGAGVDSYFEYLIKGAILLNRPELMEMFIEGRKAIDKYLNKDDWQIWVSMNKGQMTLPVFQSLQAFWPGVLALIGDINPAMKILFNMHTVWKKYGFLAEMYNIPNGEPSNGRESYPLRPELIESVMYLYRATGDPYLLEVGEDILTSIESSARTSCGYATIKNVKDHRKQDNMESFFLAETTKYLYLLFDPDNFINSDGRYGTVIDTKNGECIIESSYIFNTEAHPIDYGALKCCYDLPRESLVKGFNRQKFLGDVAIEKSYVEEEAVPVDDETKLNEAFKKQLLDEILSSLADKQIKQGLIQKRLVEVTNRETENAEDNSNKDAKQAENDGSDEMEKLEIIRLSNELDSDEEGVNQSTRYDENEAELKLDEIVVKDEDSKNSQLKISKKSIDKNSSIIGEFVKNILKTTRHKRPKNFDPQTLLENIKANQFPRNQTWTNQYDLLTCKAQAYSYRISAMGEFY